ncbi:MAG TPA: hypothetical protein VNE63_00805 [Candidatus Acidoferrales bacterium]|nr:hypothetical protein [Candidatus Acidoferrales bacterium]
MDAIVWPLNQHKSNQIQQVKGTAKAQNSQVNPSTQPCVPSVAARTTPQKVSKVRVVLRPGSSGQKSVTVQFNHPSGDPYFSGASVYLRQSGKQPVLVASGHKSPPRPSPGNFASPLTFNSPSGKTGALDLRNGYKQ